MTDFSRSGFQSETANVIAFTLNAMTSTTICPANKDRRFFCVDNNFNTQGVWVKLQPASEDDDQKGIFLQSLPLRGFTVWEMPQAAIYTGEISAMLTQERLKSLLRNTDDS